MFGEVDVGIWEGGTAGVQACGPPSSGTITGVSTGSVATTGTIDGGAVTTISVSSDMNGTITAHGAGTIGDVSIGGSLGGRKSAVEGERAGPGGGRRVTKKSGGGPGSG